MTLVCISKIPSHDLQDPVKRSGAMIKLAAGWHNGSSPSLADIRWWHIIWMNRTVVKNSYCTIILVYFVHRSSHSSERMSHRDGRYMFWASMKVQIFGKDGLWTSREERHSLELSLPRNFLVDHKMKEWCIDRKDGERFNEHMYHTEQNRCEI